MEKTNLKEVFINKIVNDFTKNINKDTNKSTNDLKEYLKKHIIICNVSNNKYRRLKCI